MDTNITTNNEMLAAKRTKCEIYTRIMGYYRPVSQFNQGKKSEFYSRDYYSINNSTPRRFLEEYASIPVSVCMDSEKVCA